MASGVDRLKSLMNGEPEEVPAKEDRQGRSGLDRLNALMQSAGNTKSAAPEPEKRDAQKEKIRQDAAQAVASRSASTQPAGKTGSGLLPSVEKEKGGPYSLTPAMQAEFQRRNSGDTGPSYVAPNATQSRRIQEANQRKAMDGTGLKRESAADPTTYRQTAEYRRAQQEAAERDARLQEYRSLMSRPDFAENSRYRADSGDRFYDMVNGDEKARTDYFNEVQKLYDPGNQSILAGLWASTQAKQEAKQMSRDQIAIYNYLYRTEGQEKAQEYYDFIQPELNAAERKADQEEWSKYAEEDPVGTSIFSSLMSPTKALSYIGQTADYLKTGKIDENAAYNRFSNIPSDIRGTVSRQIEDSGKWGKAGSFLYQTGMSMGDFLTNLAVSGGIDWISLGLMGTGAAADTVISSKQRGLSDTESFILGTIAGAAEIITEKVSLDKLLDATALGKSTVGYLLQNILAEGSEEVGSDAINLLADILVMGDKSEWKQSIRDIRKENPELSEKQAWLKAFVNQAEQMGLSALGGALSGAGMAGGGIGVNYALNTGSAAAGRLAAAGARTEAQKKAQGDPEIAARAADTDSESLRRYSDIFNRAEAARALQQGADPASVNDAAYITDSEAGNYFYIWAAQGAQAADAYFAQYLEPAIQGRKTRAAEYRATQAAEEQAQRAQEAAPPQNAATVGAETVPGNVETAPRAEAPQRGAERAEERNEAAAPPARSVLTLPSRKSIAQNEAAEGVPMRAEPESQISPTVEQTPSVMEQPEDQEARSGQDDGRKTRTRQADLAKRRQRQMADSQAESLRAHGFESAGEQATVYVRNEERWDADEKAVAKALRAIGIEPTFVTGLLLQDSTGRRSGFLREGNRLALQSDSRTQTLQELAEKALGRSLNVDSGAFTEAAQAARQSRSASLQLPSKGENERAKAVRESARTAGASKEDADSAVRLATLLGRDIRFYSDPEQSGSWTNGYTENGTIYINTGVDRKPIVWVVAHELTHNVENSRAYQGLLKLAKRSYGDKWAQMVESRVNSAARVADRLGNAEIRLNAEQAERELTADFFANQLLTDEKAIRQVVNYDATTARRIVTYLKNLLNKLQGKEPTLEWAIDRYNAALKETAQGAQTKGENRGKQFSAGDDYTDGRGREAYRYDTLIKKAPITVVTMPQQTLYDSNGDIDRAGLAGEAKAKAKELILPGDTKQHYTYVKDIGENVLLPQKGLIHGMVGRKGKPTTINTAAVTASLPEILENSVAVNELNPRKSDAKEGKYSYLLFGYARDVTGNEYLVKSTVVNRGENISGVEGIEIYNVLKGSKGRKIGASVMGGTAGTNIPATSSRALAPTITIADLLDVVNQNYPELLPEDIRKHFNSTIKPVPNLRYSAESEEDEDIALGGRRLLDTPALKKMGVKVSGSVGRYSNTEQLLAKDKAAKELKKAAREAEKRLSATEAEMEFASGIAAMVYDEEDIPSRLNKDTVMELADYYWAADSANLDTLHSVRADINQGLRDEARSLLNDAEYRPMSMLLLNERTPERSFRRMFGDKGEAIIRWLIDPVRENEAEKIRWYNRQMDAVRQFKDGTGKTRELTRDESALTMKVMEGRAAAETIAAMEADPKNRSGKEAAKNIRNAAENILNGEDPADAAREFSLDDRERELAGQYAQWMNTQKELESADHVIVEAAAAKYAEIFDDFYAAINDFLVAHGYEPIGYIRGYAPHMQPEENHSGLEKAFKALGINTEVTELPASIAGQTTNFKPNKRWNPYFLQRNGSTADYDIVRAFQSYVDYMADILYHTDDVMRIRQTSNWIRQNNGPEEIRHLLDWAQELRNAPTEVKQRLLRDAGEIGRTTVLSAVDTETRMQEYTDKLFEKIGDTAQYSNLVMWLDNYANILAGKQSFADRGWEYSTGRKSLNWANRLNNAFQKANVAGNLSSVLNQTAQLPMIAAELGERDFYQALFEVVTGKARHGSFLQDSDFLTAKAGKEMLYTDNAEKFISALFAPAGVADSLVSTVAVRGAFNKAIRQGASYQEAMKQADAFGQSVMGSRAKGSRPLAYESKGFFSKMVHMFQVEAVNSWDHILTDIPREIRKIAISGGKDKAARALGALIIRALLGAFFMNRLTETLYGGTPAPFDVLGLTANFVASGKGLSTNRYLATITDNVLEKLGAERILGTEPMTAKDFDLERAAEELTYNVMNDLPLIRNAAGVMGLGDQTVPLPGASGEFADLAKAAKNMLKDGVEAGEVEDLLRSAVKTVTQFIPGGRQLSKTAQGAEAAIRGGSYKGVGDKERLQYPISGAFDIGRALLFGKSATTAADDFWASGRNSLTAKQTGLYKSLAASGLDRKTAYEAIQRYREIDNDKSLSSFERGRAERELISGLDTSDDNKLEMYRTLGNADSRVEKFQAIMDTGLSFADCMDIYDRYAEIDTDEESRAGDKAKDFALWVDQQGYSADQAAEVKEQFKYWQIIPASASRYEKIAAAGLDADTAYKLDKAISALEPEAGKSDVSDIQKWQAVIQTVSGTADQMKALGAIMTENQFAKFQTASDAGISAKTYIDYKAGTKDLTADKDASGNSITGSLKAKVVAYIDSLNLTPDQKGVLLTDYNGTYSQTDITWHNGSYRSGGGGGGGLYAPARHRTLRLPSVKDTAEQSGRNSGGLQLPKIPERKQTSGGLQLPKIERTNRQPKSMLHLPKIR